MAREFSLIAKYFRPLAGEGAFNLTDDAAVISPPEGRQLVLTADAIVEGVHFLPADPPETIGRKLLRVNLSDLAAMGATPFAYLLTVSVPATTPENWFEAFAAGLALDQAAFGIALLGGDTTSTPGPISLCATLLGHVAPGAALRRNGARPGDGIWVTGTVGDAALGLLALRGLIPDPDGTLAGRYRLPRPRLGLNLAGIVSAAIDVSDGLIQDAGHLCTESGLAADIEADRIPLSQAARQAGPQHLATCLTGGDDYELLLAVPPAQAEPLRQEANRAGLAVTRIGIFAQGQPRVRVRDRSGADLSLEHLGWSHF